MDVLWKCPGTHFASCVGSSVDVRSGSVFMKRVYLAQDSNFGSLGCKPLVSNYRMSKCSALLQPSALRIAYNLSVSPWVCRATSFVPRILQEQQTRYCSGKLSSVQKAATTLNQSPGSTYCGRMDSNAQSTAFLSRLAAQTDLCFQILRSLQPHLPNSNPMAIQLARF